MKAEYKKLDEELARRSHAGTSFSPEKRGEQEISGHKEVFDSLAEELGDFFDQEKADKLHKLYTDYLVSHGNVMSSMITGPANFPVERNRKRSDWADNKNKMIWEYVENLKKWKRQADRREEVKEAGGELAIKKAELAEAVKHHQMMKDSNKVIKSALKTGGITRETKGELISLGFSEEAAEAITNPTERMRHFGLGFESFVLTNSNAKIKRIAARVAELERIEAVKESGDTPKEFDIKGGKVIFDPTSNRINIKHEEKPDRETIDIIKQNGFKWSRKFGTWTRLMTQNANYAAERVIELLNKEI